MKKIFIVSACALSLCLTSCASKKAPVPNNKLKAPDELIDSIDAAETEDSREAEEETDDESDGTNSRISETQNTGTTSGDAAAESSDETSGSDTASNAEENSEKTESFGAEPVNSEDFPEPEEISEPEIITLEPIEETASSQEDTAAEQVVEEEEPPVIYETENSQSELSEKGAESDLKSASERETLQTSDNDIVIEEAGTATSSDDGVVAIGGGIDITEEESSDETDSEKLSVIIPSRSVTLKKFEYLDVTYPGSGWIYMGLTDNSKDLAYFGRKLGTKDTKFSLQARTAGTKIIHFYRNDPLSGRYLDDYIEVIILAENGSNKTHIEAPEYKLPVQKDEEIVEETQASEEESKEETSQEKDKAASDKENTQTASKTASKSTETTSAKSAEAKSTNTASSKSESASSSSTASTTSASTKSDDTTTTAAAEKEETSENQTASQTSTSPATLLQEAQLLYNEKEYAAALAKLNLFFELSTDNRDQALYLKGQILEAKSDVRDIKGAIDAYTSLTKNYPASKLWDSANKRIIYLRRFYMEVR